MATVVHHPRRRRGSRLLLWLLVTLLLLPFAAAGALWVLGPWLLAPVEDFEQGPGAAVAYISLSQQLRNQLDQFWAGKPISVTLSETEFSGLLASAVLSGRAEHNPVRKVRAQLINDQIRVETVLVADDERIPERFRTPKGLRVRMRPSVTDAGSIRLEITRASVGRVPIPIEWIRWAGRTFRIETPGFDARTAVIELPLGEMLGGQFGRTVQISQLDVNEGHVTMTLTIIHN